MEQFCQFRFASSRNSNRPPFAQIPSRDTGKLYLEKRWVLLHQEEPDKVLAFAETQGQYGKFHQLTLLLGSGQKPVDWQSAPFRNQLSLLITGLFIVAPVDFIQVYDCEGTCTWENCSDWGHPQQLWTLRRFEDTLSESFWALKTSRHHWLDQEFSAADRMDLRYLERRTTKPTTIQGHGRRRSLFEILFGKKKL